MNPLFEISLVAYLLLRKKARKERKSLSLPELVGLRDEIASWGMSGIRILRWEARWRARRLTQQINARVTRESQASGFSLRMK